MKRRSGRRALVAAVSNVIALKRLGAAGVTAPAQHGPTAAISKPEGRGSMPCTCRTAPGTLCMACGYFAGVQRGIAQRRASSARMAR